MHLQPGMGQQPAHRVGIDELVEVVGALGDLPEALRQRDGQQLRPGGPVGRGQDQQAARRQPRGEVVDERLRVGDMLDHLHRGDEVELALDRLHPDRAIVDRQPLPRRMSLRDLDQFRRGIDRGDLRAQPRQRLGQQPGAAADVERGLARQAA